VLDVGCGYGRIAIPLAVLGYDVTGIDVAPGLLKAARRHAGRRNVRVRFDEGSMTALPYPDAGFDALICLWSAFYELLEHDEQVGALREMGRVLSGGGLGIVEGPIAVAASTADLETGRRHGPDNRLVADRISGHATGHFVHDAGSLRAVAAEAGLVGVHVVERPWGGRPRQVLRFEPAVAAAR
jgi:ubiquinone/menaquinone biosynthesis C-methylase UbiE